MNLNVTFNSEKHLTSATKAAFTIMDDAFGRETDAMARVNRDNFMHVYDWGDDVDPKANVGHFGSRLFITRMSGRGGNRTIFWNWLPSHNEVPIVAANYPEGFEVSKLNHHHVFEWKAPVMEYGQDVNVRTKNSNLLVIPFPASYSGLGPGTSHSDGTRSVLMTKQPYTFNPGQRAGVVGNFTAWFMDWWGGGRAATIQERLN
jgi:hypothetical protein